MTNKYLSRQDAPFDEEIWKMLDHTMVEAARSVLSARRLLDVEGPYGLGLKAVPLLDPESDSGPLVSPMLPLALISKTFTLGKRDLAVFEKNGGVLDTSPIARAAIECAKMEDDLVFKGMKDVPGLMTARGTGSVKLAAWSEIGTAADDIIKAVTSLDNAGFHGPYCLALEPGRYNMLFRRYQNGNMSELEHIKTIATGGVFKVPVLEGVGIVISAGRHNASIVLGQDMSIGFIGPAEDRLEFSLSESLAPYIRHPKAICVLKQ